LWNKSGDGLPTEIDFKFNMIKQKIFRDCIENGLETPWENAIYPNYQIQTQ